MVVQFFGIDRRLRHKAKRFNEALELKRLLDCVPAFGCGPTRLCKRGEDFLTRACIQFIGHSGAST